MVLVAFGRHNIHCGLQYIWLADENGFRERSKRHEVEVQSLILVYFMVRGNYE